MKKLVVAGSIVALAGVWLLLSGLGGSELVSTGPVGVTLEPMEAWSWGLTLEEIEEAEPYSYRVSFYARPEGPTHGELRMLGGCWDLQECVPCNGRSGVQVHGGGWCLVSVLCGPECVSELKERGWY